MELLDIFEKTPKNNFIHKVVLSISSLLIIIASIQFGISQYLLANGELAEATLVEFKEIRSADRNSNSTSYAPVYEYMNKFNKKIRYESSESSAFKFGDIGDKVIIVYIPESNRTRVNSFWGLYGFASILTIIALPLFLLSLYYFLFNKG